MPRSRLPLARSPEERELVDIWGLRGLSPRTMKLYLTAIRAAQSWCAANAYELTTLPVHATIEYAESLPRTWASRRRVKSALGAYWDAKGRSDSPVSAIRVPSQPRMKSKALEESAAAALASAAAMRRDHKGLAVLLGLYLGLRREEIATVEWPAFDLEQGWLRVVGKGDVTADLPVHPVVVAALAELDHKHPRWVFPGRLGGPVCPTTIWCWVRDVAKDAKLDPVATHVLRHTCLTTANDATGDLRAVQSFARHARPETTAGYTRVNRKRMLGVMLSLDYDAAAREAS